MKLWGDDPGAMKDFILSIQNSENQLKTCLAGQEDGKAETHSKRMEFMLETICDIKNNKKGPKADPSHHTRIEGWLQNLKAEDVLLCGLKWSKLLVPDKKGQWWLSRDVLSIAGNIEDATAVISKEVVVAQKLVQLAAAQWMNTDLRRAILCIIMSAGDYADTFEKLLRLGLSGKQDRPITHRSRDREIITVPSLYNDLEMVFQFQNVEKVPELIQCDSEEQLTRSGAQEKPSGDVDASESDSDEDPQYGEELQAPVQKQWRANQKYTASITLVDIAQYFHLPIREASSTLKIGVSILKRKCRQYGIPRWPHRKIKSLDSLIHDLEYVIDDTERYDVQQEKQKQEEKEKEKQDAILALTKRKRMLETEKETIRRKPAMDLMTENHKLRSREEGGQPHSKVVQDTKKDTIKCKLSGGWFDFGVAEMQVP